MKDSKQIRGRGMVRGRTTRRVKPQKPKEGKCKQEEVIKCSVFLQPSL